MVNRVPRGSYVCPCGAIAFRMMVNVALKVIQIFPKYQRMFLYVTSIERYVKVKVISAKLQLHTLLFQLGVSLAIDSDRIGRLTISYVRFSIQNM
jgi:hypothetical protein